MLLRFNNMTTSGGDILLTDNGSQNLLWVGGHFDVGSSSKKRWNGGLRRN